MEPFGKDGFLIKLDPDFKMPTIMDWITDPKAVSAWLLFHPDNGECLGAVSVRPEMAALRWPVEADTTFLGVQVGMWWGNYEMDLVLRRGAEFEVTLNALTATLRRSRAEKEKAGD